VPYAAVLATNAGASSARSVVVASPRVLVLLFRSVEATDSFISPGPRTLCERLVRPCSTQLR